MLQYPQHIFDFGRPKQFKKWVNKFSGMSLRACHIVIVCVEPKFKPADITGGKVVKMIPLLVPGGLAFSLFPAVSISQICGEKSHIQLTHIVLHPVSTVSGKEE